MHKFYINQIILDLERGGSLCLRWSFSITPDLPVPPCPSPCCLCPCSASTAYLPRFLGGGPSLTPLPQADPISLRSQASPSSHVGHITPPSPRYIDFLSLQVSVHIWRREWFQEVFRNAGLYIFIYFGYLMSDMGLHFPKIENLLSRRSNFVPKIGSY
jgi:hypothetical protein